MALTTLKPGGIHSDLVTAVSGSVTAVSSSLASRLTTEEVEAEGTVVSSSAQIATDISGSITSVSSSLASRIDTKGTDMTLATASIASNESNMTLATASIAAITASVSTAKTDISTNSANMTLATASIAAITASVSSLKTTSFAGTAGTETVFSGSVASTGSFGQLKVNSIDGDNIKFDYNDSANLKIIHKDSSDYSRIYMGHAADPGLATIIFDHPSSLWQMSGFKFIFGSNSQFREVHRSSWTPSGGGYETIFDASAFGAGTFFLMTVGAAAGGYNWNAITFWYNLAGARGLVSVQISGIGAAWSGGEMTINSNNTVAHIVTIYLIGG